MLTLEKLDDPGLGVFEDEFIGMKFESFELNRLLLEFTERFDTFWGCRC